MAMNGTIKRMVSEKGFGFVAAEDGTFQGREVRLEGRVRRKGTAP